MSHLKLILADTLALLHAAFSLFVLFGLGWLIVSIVLSEKYQPVKIFRMLHALAVLALLLRLLFGLPCPFSALENHLRAETKTDSKVIFILHKLAFRNAQPSR